MISSAFLSFCLLAAGAEPVGDAPAVFEVEGQPLGANVKRLIDALDYLGSPLSPEDAAAWRGAADERDAARLQKLIDPRVLLVLHLNPESRVKVRRGPARGELQQGGFTPVVVKVLNESTVSKRMRIVSPQVRKLSVSGVGLRSHTSVAIRMFRALAEAGINLELINTSEVQVNVIVDGKQGQQALQRLQAAFGDVVR